MNEIMRRRRALMGMQSKAAPILPAEYQQVEWVQGDGIAYIATGITPTINSAMQGILSAKSQTNANFLGSRDGNGGTDNAFLVASYNSAHRFGFMRWGYGVQTIAFDTDWHDFYLSPTEAKVDGVAYTLSSPKAQTSNRTIFLFRDNGAVNNIFISVKRFKFWEAGELIADYVPCYRKADGVIGMYDLVSRSFKTDSGGGTFTKGADV